MSSYPRVSRTGRLRRLLSRSFSWVSCLRFAATLGALAIVNLLLPDDVSSAVHNPMGAAAAIAVGLGTSRVRARRAWNAIAAGVFLYSLADVAGAIVPGGNAVAPTDVALVTSALILVSYSLLAAGLTFMLINRKSH